MDFRERCREANQIDMVDYLASLGYQPAKPPRGNSYWYLSMLPDRYEKTPSFKVNRNKNKWYDFGLDMKKGEGSLIDFGLRYHRCTIPEFLDMLSVPAAVGQYVPHQLAPVANEPEHKIVIVEDKPIQSFGLINYLHSRHIPLDLAQQYCREVTYKFKDKTYYSIGFKNDLGGYELRNKFFKNASSPKTSTFIDNGADQVTVFEGFFDFLSFQTINRQQEIPLTNFLILNSLSFFTRARPIMERYERVNLYLDRDNSGMKTTKQALEIDNKKYQDHSDLYNGYTDVNEWHCKIAGPPGLRHSRPSRRQLHI
jgi:hypothetical protein